MADATTTARLIGHMTYTRAPAVHEKNIFHLPYFIGYKPSPAISRGPKLRMFIFGEIILKEK